MRVCGHKGPFQCWKLSHYSDTLSSLNITVFLPSSQYHSMILVEKVVVEPEAAGWTAETDSEISSRSGTRRRFCLVQPSGVTWNCCFTPILGPASVLHRETLGKAETILCFFKMPVKQNIKSTESLQSNNFVSTSSRV